MDTQRHPTHDVGALVRHDNTSIPPMPRLHQSGLLSFEVSDFAEAALRGITVSMVVLAIHLAALKYVFLVS